MKKLILFFLIILGSVWLGIKVSENPGYVILVYKHWVVETTTWFLVLVGLLIIFLAHLLLKIIRGTVHLPARIDSWWQARFQRKSIRRLNRGYLDLLKGKWKSAERQLLKSAENKELSFMSYTAAALAADELHATKKRDIYLQQAKSATGQDSYAADVMHIKLLLKNQQTEEALSLLLDLRNQYPKESYLLKLLTETYLQMHDWYHLQALLEEIRRKKIYPQDQFALIEKQTYLNSLNEHFFTEFSSVQLLWNQVPRHLRHTPEILIAYASHLNRWNRGKEAEALIRKELRRHFDVKLMEYYVTTRSEEPAKQLALGESYIKANADNPNSLKAMGILCLRNHLWGQARDYLEKSLKLQKAPETYSALGFIYEKLGESDKALRYYRKGLSYELFNH